MKKTTLFAILLVLSSLVMAKVYTWKDASGKTIYSDTPPPARAIKEVNIQVAPVVVKKKSSLEKETNVADKEPTLSEQQAALTKKIEEENKRIEEENKKIEEENKRRNADNCTSARSNLASATAANNQPLMQRYQNGVKSYCK